MYLRFVTSLSTGIAVYIFFSSHFGSQPLSRLMVIGFYKASHSALKKYSTTFKFIGVKGLIGLNVLQNTLFTVLLNRNFLSSDQMVPLEVRIIFFLGN